jgi:hypothetical protein
MPGLDVRLDEDEDPQEKRSTYLFSLFYQFKAIVSRDGASPETIGG